MTENFLLQLILILMTARLMGELAARFNVPSVIGEIIAGILLGPTLLGWITLSPPIELLSQIGIILLLFEVGLDTDVGRLGAAGPKALLVALVGVTAPFIGGFILSYFYFQLSTLVSLLIGSTLTATSIGITLRVLQDLKRHSTEEAQIIIGAAVLDDILGIVFLSMLYEFSTSGEINIFNTLKVLLLVALFILLSPICAKVVSIAVRKWNEKSAIKGLLPATILSLILFFSWVAHNLGAPELLGGFAAGLALSRQFFLPFAAFINEEKDFSHQLEQEMSPIIHLFTPIFFVAIGLSLDLSEMKGEELSTYALFTLTLLLVAILGKLASGFILFREKFSSRLIIGTAMIPRGEVGLIFANVGLTTGLIADGLYGSLILVITLTTLIAPFLLRGVYNYYTPQRTAT